MKKFKIITTLLALVMLVPVFTHQGQAQSDATSSSEVEVKQSVEDRVKQVINKSSASPNADRKIKGYVGTVDSVTDQSISVSLGDQPELFSVDDATLIFDSDLDEVIIEEVPLSSQVIITSQADESATMYAIRIDILDDEVASVDKVTSLFQIESYDEVDETISGLILPNLLELELEVTNDSELIDDLTQEDVIDAEDLYVADTAIVIYEEYEQDSFELLQLVRVSSESTESATLEE